MSFDRAMGVTRIDLDPRSDSRPIQIPPGVIVDQAFRSTNLAEMEDVLNRMVSRQKLVPLTKSRTIDGSFRYRGLANFGFFTTRFGQEIKIELAPEKHEGLLAFAMTTHGRGHLLMRKEEYTITPDSGVVMTSAN